MSVFRQEALVCPQCGHRNVETVAVSLHGSRVPEVVSSIVDGSFQCFACAACGLPYRADGPLIYVDFVTKRWIGEFPASMERDWASLEQQPMDCFRQSVIDFAPPILRHAAHGFIVRAVFGLDALAEKIRLLEAGVDDRAVEVVKLATVLQLGGALTPSRRPRVTAVDDDALTLLLWMGEGHDETGGEPAFVRLDRTDVDAVARSSDWEAVLRELQVGPYVDTGRILLDGRESLRAAAG